MDLNKWQALTALIRDAKLAEQEANAAGCASDIKWKADFAKLQEAQKLVLKRMDALDAYIEQMKIEATGDKP